MFKILLMYSTWGFNFIKTVYVPLVHVSMQILIYHVQY